MGFNDMEQRIMLALNSDDEPKQISYRRPRTIPLILDGQMVWIEAKNYKIRDYTEYRRDGVLISVSYSIFIDDAWNKAEVGFLEDDKAAA